MAHHVGEGEPALDVEVILAITLGAAGLREPVVQVDAVARRDPLHVTVEYPASALVLVEAEVTEVVQETTGLRRNFRVDALDIVRQRVGIAVIVMLGVANK